MARGPVNPTARWLVSSHSLQKEARRALLANWSASTVEPDGTHGKNLFPQEACLHPPWVDLIPASQASSLGPSSLGPASTNPPHSLGFLESSPRNSSSWPRSQLSERGCRRRGPLVTVKRTRPAYPQQLGNITEEEEQFPTWRHSQIIIPQRGTLIGVALQLPPSQSSQSSRKRDGVSFEHYKSA